jgi:hypothetical protein
MGEVVKRLLLGHPLAHLNKALVGLTGALGELVPVLALHGTAERVVTILLASLTAITTYLIPNADKES